MTFTLTIPTWKVIKDAIFLVVLYYAALVEPRYDWFVFGVAYFLGTLTMAREVYRENMHKDGNQPIFILCLLWPLFIPVMFMVWFIYHYVTFGNPKTTNSNPPNPPSPPKPPRPTTWSGTVYSKIEKKYDNELWILENDVPILIKDVTHSIWLMVDVGDTIFGKINPYDNSYRFGGFKKKNGETPKPVDKE